MSFYKAFKILFHSKLSVFYIFFIAYCDGHLLVFSETHLDVFNTQTAEWVQSIGLKRSRPLSNQGNLSLTFINESPIIIYLANMHTSKSKSHQFHKNVSSF